MVNELGQIGVDREQPGGLHESEFERTGFELGPTKSADIDGEAQSF